MTLPSGIPVGELDPGVRPQDDLFRHVNGRWLARTEIPADRARDGAFRVLADEAENAVREIVEEAASAPEGSEERKFGDLYASFMDADPPATRRVSSLTWLIPARPAGRRRLTAADPGQPHPISAAAAPLGSAADGLIRLDGHEVAYGTESFTDPRSWWRACGDSAPRRTALVTQTPLDFGVTDRHDRPGPVAGSGLLASVTDAAGQQVTLL